MKEAMEGPEAQEWSEAICDELKSILKKKTWEMANRPRKEKTIGCRIILCNKLNSNGSVERRKARLVAQGFRQQPEIHFSKTFASVARIGSIRLMVSLAVKFGMKIWQSDITTAYLNGNFEEQIYMEPPENFEELLKTVINSEGKSEIGQNASDMLSKFLEGDKVCLLKKAIYGLRQAGRSWYLKFDKIL